MHVLFHKVFLYRCTILQEKSTTHTCTLSYSAHAVEYKAQIKSCLLMYFALSFMIVKDCLHISPETLTNLSDFYSTLKILGFLMFSEGI